MMKKISQREQNTFAGRAARRSAIAAVAVVGAILAWAAPEAAYAQHCKLHYAEAFQLISIRTMAGQSAEQIKGTVDDLFGPRQELCGEKSYKFFLDELKTYASTAFRKKGPEGEAGLLATREILNRFPLQVRFGNGVDPNSGLKQLRSDLGVLGSEVGMSPSIQAVLDALAKVVPPKVMARPLPTDDDAIPVTVPRVPMPAWAIISLYEIRDHAKRKENGAILNKTNLILEWIARINSGARPGDVKVTHTPPGAPAAKPPAAAPAQAPVQK